MNQSVPTDFQASASKLLDDFYAAEPVLSGKPQDELVRLGGLPSATIGLVMHCPSQNKSSNDFFDYQNPLLKLLMDKGITASNSYGFDWHWRSEPHERHQKCPARGYSVELRSIHEIMTCNLLEALPLPLLVISGSCPWKNYLKTLSSQARHVKVPIRPGVFCSFVLDFRPDRLRRITCHIPHPESIFYNKTLEWEYDSVDLAIMIDCSFNLVLEFAGLTIKSIMTDRVNATNNTSRQVERNIKAKAAVEVGDEENLPSPAAKRQRRGPTHGAMGHELWHSKAIKVHAGGDISLQIPSENKSLKIRMGAKLDRKLKAKEMNNSVVPKNYTIEFAVDGIRIRYGTEVIWHKTISV